MSKGSCPTCGVDFRSNCQLSKHVSITVSIYPADTQQVTITAPSQTGSNDQVQQEDDDFNADFDFLRIVTHFGM